MFSIYVVRYEYSRTNERQEGGIVPWSIEEERARLGVQKQQGRVRGSRVTMLQQIKSSRLGTLQYLTVEGS